MDKFDLDRPILSIPTNPYESHWTIRHAVEGVQIFGGIGSGKTSGSGRMLALKYLAGDFGGLVLTAKQDEKEMWEEYCRLTNRTKDLIILEPGGAHNFNFLDYESRQSDTNDAITENVVDVLKTVIRAGEEKDSGKGDDVFWESALDMLMFNVIDLCRLAYGAVSVEKMYEIVQTLPKLENPTPAKEAIKDKKPAEKMFDKAYAAAFAKIEPQVKAWFNNLSPEQKLALVDEDAYNEAVTNAIPDARLLKYLYEFFYESFKNLSIKTRSIIEFIFSGFLFRLLREPVYSMLP